MVPQRSRVSSYFCYQSWFLLSRGLVYFFNAHECAYMYVCAPYVYSTCGCQKKVPDFQELKLQVVVSHLLWILELKPRFSARVADALDC